MTICIWLALWIISVICVQITKGTLLAALCLLILVQASLVDGKRLRTLLWRMRWLLLTMLLLTGWMTPGVYALPELGHFSPTLEGLGLALRQWAHLIALLSMVVWLFARWTATQIALALAQALSPLRYVGLDTPAFARRLALVFQYLENLPDMRDWQKWLLHADAVQVSHEGVAVQSQNASFPANPACSETMQSGWAPQFDGTIFIVLLSLAVWGQLS